MHTVGTARKKFLVQRTECSFVQTVQRLFLFSLFLSLTRSVLANCGSFGGLIFLVSSALVSVVTYSKVWGGWGFLRTNKGEIYSPIPYVRAWREYRTIALKEDKDRTKGKGRRYCLGKNFFISLPRYLA